MRTSSSADDPFLLRDIWEGIIYTLWLAHEEAYTSTGLARDVVRIPITFADTMFLDAIDHLIVFILILGLFLHVGQRSTGRCKGLNRLAHVG